MDRRKLQNSNQRRKDRSNMWLTKLLTLTVKKITQYIGRIQSELRASELGAEHLPFLWQLVQRNCTHHS